MWKALYNASADVILAGHDHNYERFAPQTPTGAADSARGIRQFVIGTGGYALVSMGTTRANSEVRDNATMGAVKFTLKANSYDWQFIKVGTAGTLADKGSATCH